MEEELEKLFMENNKQDIYNSALTGRPKTCYKWHGEMKFISQFKKNQTT